MDSELSSEQLTTTDQNQSECVLTLEEMYEVAVNHYKQVRNDLAVSYEDRLNLVAYWRQVTRGKWEASKTKDVGYFDVIGNDRIKAWRALGDMGTEEAQQKFVDTLTICSAQLQGLMLERKTAKEEAERREREAREREERERREREERERMEEEERRRRKEEEERLKQQQQLQAELEQQRQMPHPKTETPQQIENQNNSESQQPENAVDQPDGSETSETSANRAKYAVHQIGADDFISEMKKDPDSCIVVGRGECVTVRVPTRADGSALYWEFATENFDIAFGLSFEWGYSVPTTSGNGPQSDAGSGEGASKASNPDALTRVDPILPILRRNSHEQVISGRHKFPGAGVYLLQFDNSYSRVRSKTLYYRVYYTK